MSSYNTPLKNNLKLNILSDDQDIVVQADETKLNQVLLNLISNAIKYNQENGSVNIDWCIAKDNNLVKISIIDTGIGISVDNQTKVFSPFNRLGKENSAIEGTGVGLVVTKNMIDLMNGEIGFDSE